MTVSFEEKIILEKVKSTQPLSGRQKFMFAMICWGVESWSKARNFKARGYDQKHIDAKKSMLTGLVIYSLGIVIFILLLL